jgi:hypothetical protein
MKPTKKDFGWTSGLNYTPEKEAAYNAAMALYEALPPRPPGRTRIKPVHPSWEPYDALFDRNDPTHSQGAFARWAGMATGTVSAAKYKQISPRMAEKISIWIEELEKLESNE